MKRSTIILISITASLIEVFLLCESAHALSLKLPYAKGQEFVVVQGYDSPPTHIKKDEFALDVSQNGCDAYGKKVVATAAGTAELVLEQGYNGGYGTELLINHGNHLVSRYAHMIPDTITVLIGQPIRQGQVVGAVGNTGLVAGLACPAYPGTHLHFAMDIQNPDGSLTAYKPEPISGYFGMTAGRWYLSDNDLENDAAVIAPTLTNETTSQMPGEILGAYITAIDSPAPVSQPTSTVSVPTSTVVAPPSGGVTIAPVLPAVPPVIISVAVASSTNTTSSDQTSTLFEQLDDTALANSSWYDDNWYDLGTGFSGTLHSLTLEGKINASDYFNSHVWLQEYKDPQYTAMVQQFTISDDAPFTFTMATATFNGLSITLKPYFYYRLATLQEHQNRSIQLAGTISTGTMMWNNFVYGVGRVESTSTFMPFMIMNGATATSTLTPPSITTPSNLTTIFDSDALTLSLSLTTSTDPDWPANPLHYEWNYSTGTTLSDDSWGLPLPIVLVPGNSYLIGVRAADNFGDVSLVATTTWNFPSGFVPYMLSPGLGYADQEFWLSTSTQLNSITIFTANFQTTARFSFAINCSLSLIYSSGTDDVDIPSDNVYPGNNCSGDLTFSFASTSPLLSAGHPYHWVFSAPTGNPSTQAAVQFYGTTVNSANGLFSDPSLVNARFVINGSSGVVFSN